MPGVPRSTYYWMIEHPEAGRVDPIAGDVHAVRRDGHERCGAGKIKVCFVKFLWAVSAFLLVRLSGCF